MLAWLMNLDFAGGQAVAEIEVVGDITVRHTAVGAFHLHATPVGTIEVYAERVATFDLDTA